MSKAPNWKTDDVGNVFLDSTWDKGEAIGFFHDLCYAWQARDAVNERAALLSRFDALLKAAEEMLTGCCESCEWKTCDKCDWKAAINAAEEVGK